MKTLVIGKNWPEPTSSAAGTRTLEIIRCLKNVGWPVYFGSAAQKNEHSYDLDNLKVESKQLQMNHSSFDDWVKEIAPELVIFDRFMTEEQFSWRVRKACPQAARVIDTSDFHALREGRMNALNSGEDFKPAIHMSGDYLERELAAILRSDLSIMISDVEQKILTEVFDIPPRLIHHTPFLAPQQLEYTPEFEERQHCVFIGGFQHAPNEDAVKWLYHSVWPIVKQSLPDIECHIYGAYPTPAIQQLNSPSTGFLIKGRTESSSQCMQQYRLNLVPLRFGAGQKGKIIDGWVNQTPTISTSLGAESMTCDEFACLMIADEPQAFAKTIIDNYNKKNAWQMYNRGALNNLNKKFNTPKNSAVLITKLLEIQQSLQQSRQMNFMGRILWREQMRSTEFMSRWIELKEQQKLDSK